MSRRIVLVSFVCSFALLLPWATAEEPAGQERGLRLPLPGRPGERDKPILVGDWLLTMPAGFEFDLRIEPDDRPNFFVLHLPGSNIAGVYELKEHRLEMSRPDDERYVGLVWEVKNANTLILIEHPEKSQHSSDYRGATLGRQKKVSPPLVRGDK